MNISKKALALHKKLGGKIAVVGKMTVKNRADLSLVYTPGVADVALYLSKNPKETRNYTAKKNLVAIVSDGSAVLGLGNIGPEGAIPVMEGKALLFKQFADVDAFPIVLATQDVDEIVETVKRIAPMFGGVNMEDISAPRCFEIEERLKRELSIPVMHDDQHGTAIVVLAGLLNACKVVGKDMKKMKVVISGAGAAGVAVAKLLKLSGVSQIIMLDRNGIIYAERGELPGYKRDLAKWTNPKRVTGGFREALTGADVLIGVSGPNTVGVDDIKAMAKKAIVFSLANPTPEIMPEEAKRGGAAVIATGRSDYPNQVNNSLVFPGIFRGALDHQVPSITDEMKLRAAKNLAGLIKKPTADCIIPDMFDKRAVKAVSSAVK